MQMKSGPSVMITCIILNIVSTIRSLIIQPIVVVSDSPTLKSRTRSRSDAATRAKRSVTISEPQTPDALAIAVQPHPVVAEPPPLILNPSPDLTDQPLNANMHEIPSVLGRSGAGPGSRGDSRADSPSLELLSESSRSSSPKLAARQPSSKLSPLDIYSARWKMSASAILKNVQQSGLVKDVKHRFTTHKGVIVASELVTHFVATRICTARQDAVDLGHHLVMDDILEHEFQEDVFKDKYMFFKLLPDAEYNATKIGAGSDDSDDNSEDFFPGDKEPDTFVQNTQIGNSGHSALAKYLMRKSMSQVGRKDDYLNDSALQDDVVAQAAADRYILPRIF
jgi:hypothetical protein